jgi:hypothetical protein
LQHSTCFAFILGGEELADWLTDEVVPEQLDDFVDAGL